MKYKAGRGQPPKPLPEIAIRSMLGVFFVSLPFVVSFTGFDKFRIPKDIYACCFILLIVAFFLASRKLKIRLRPLSWEFFFGLAILYVGLHSLLGKRPDVSLNGFFQIVYFSALLLVVAETATEQFQKRLWIWIAGAAAINSVLTVLQYLGKAPLMIRATGEELTGRINPAGLIGEVNSGGFLFALVCLISLYGMLAEKKSKVRIVWILFFLVNLTGLAFTRTLSAIVPLGLSLGIWLAFHHWWIFRSSGKVRRSLAFLWITVLLGVAGAAVVMAGSGAHARFQAVWSQVKKRRLDDRHRRTSARVCHYLGHDQEEALAGLWPRHLRPRFFLSPGGNRCRSKRSAHRSAGFVSRDS